jgi:hypothetical protein
VVFRHVPKREGGNGGFRGFFLGCAHCDLSRDDLSSGHPIFQFFMGQTHTPLP